MKVLIEVGHPAQVHQFKILAKKLIQNGHKVLFVAKKKEVSQYLLDKYQLPYVILDSPKKGMLNKILNIPRVYWRFMKILRRFNPDILLSRFTLHSSHLAKILGIPHIGFTDTEHVKMMDALTVPFVDYKFTAFSYEKDLGKNHFRYAGNIELFYLYPKVFQPDASILQYLGVEADEKYVIMRFVSWNAHHDIGQEGINYKHKLRLVEELSKYARVFISSEAELPENLQQYKIAIPPERIHDAMAFADLYIGEGGTMASEAACMGTPAIYVNSLDAGVFHEEEKYHLLYSFRRMEEGVISKALEIITKEESKKVFEEYSHNFLDKMINVSEYIYWVVEDFPRSIDEIKRNPDKQYTFK